jgi:hypothetical protein
MRGPSGEGDTGQRLIRCCAGPGTPAEQAFRLLAAQTAAAADYGV